MLVYRSPSRRAHAARLLAELHASVDDARRERARSAPSRPLPHERWVELLVAAGELEGAAVDALCPDADDDTPATRALRRLSLAAGDALARSWAEAPDDAAAIGALDACLAALDALPLPTAPLDVAVPEGYAWYGLYPECYALAARAFHAALRPSRVVCVGVRSIGTSLSAVVAAELARLGARVESFTVRPRGHPFDRRLTLRPALAAALRAHAARGAHFAVVDEGPGVSGSSFAAVVEALVALGAADGLVALFPSWVPRPEWLRSERARRAWARFPKYVASFEEAWLAGGRLAASVATLGVHAGALVELSAGAWRAHVLADERDWPAAQPRHERRKYLLPAPGDAAGAPVRLEFVGLARHGRATLTRARRLHAAGVAPRPLGLAAGFMAAEWVSGTPAAPYEADDALLDAAARYLALLRRDFASDRAAPYDELREMIRVNVREGCGEEWLPRLAALDRFEREVRASRSAEIDGRMLPHEWLRARDGRWLKTDTAHHGDGHFLPGPLDVAWDVAGAVVELGLDGARERALVRRYAAASGDAGIVARLPFHRVAYLAFRLGYVTLGAESLGDAPDAARLRALGRRYRAMLERHLLDLAGESRPALPAPYDDARVAVFDADDTLRRTTADGQPCPHGPDEWELLPGVREALRTVAWGGRGPALGVASNQDHVASGHLSERLARRLLTDMVVEATGHVPPPAAVRLCPHALDVSCDCRKPAGGMLREIARWYGAESGEVLFVGNAGSDAEAALDAGVRFVWREELFEKLAGPATAREAGSTARSRRSPIRPAIG
ncbi:MAG: HAD-IIIA family hydrolase [Gemmatimonadaceae bacterium]